MIDELDLIRDARPEVGPAGEQARARARGALDEAIAGRVRGRSGRRGWFPGGGGALALAVSVLVVAAVVGVFLGLGSHRINMGTGAGRGSLEFVFRATPAGTDHPVTASTMQQSAELVRRRLAAVIPAARVSTEQNMLIVRIPRSVEASPADVRHLVESPDELLFYDWEANVLTPRGQPVSALLQAQDPTAIAISQGRSTAAPGAPGAGSLSLYEAVKLAARQPPYTSPTNSRQGPEYFMFGKPGSPQCRAAARDFPIATLAGRPCYLTGPVASRSQLRSHLPRGVSSSGAEIVKVNRGWQVVEAAYPAYRWPALSNPSSQFFVLRDDAPLSGNDITSPHPSTDQTGAPDVSFGFTARGAAEFQSLTAAIAKRGSLVSGVGHRLFQHFAVVLGTHLITVPYIDYEAVPFGIPGNDGADIQGGFTRQAARRLAASIAPLPVRLNLISVTGRT